MSDTYNITHVKYHRVRLLAAGREVSDPISPNLTTSCTLSKKNSPLKGTMTLCLKTTNRKRINKSTTKNN